MRIYVMSRYGNLETVQRFLDDAVAAGHTISHDWTRGEGNGPDTELSLEQCQHHAKVDLEGAGKADLCVFLADCPEFCGSLIEFGYAVAWGRPIWVVAPWRFSIFWRLPNVEIIDSENTARDRLGMRQLHVLEKFVDALGPIHG